MSKYHGNGERCPHCGITYRRLRTGLTYRDVFLMFWTGDDPSEWRYKKRHTVLGKWFQIKQETWRHHLAECARYQRWKRRQCSKERKYAASLGEARCN